MNSEERHEARYRRRKAERERKRREKLERYDSLKRVSSPSALLRAHWEARRGVMWKASPARYDRQALRNSAIASRKLLGGENVCDGFYAFDIVERGKQRHIHSLHYTERVIRRSLCTNALIPIFSNGLIYDNGASLKGKGIHFAQRRCETHLHRYYREHGSDGWVLVIDFSKYFDRIRHDILFRQLDGMLQDEGLKALCRACISAGDFDKPPEGKGRGLYIGPEDSQIYAVAYPNAIDHTIKDRWRIRYYARYMDDSYIIHHDKAELQRIRDELFRMYEEAGIVPNRKKTQIVKLSKGFTFLKTRYILTESGKLIRKPERSGTTRQRRKLKSLRRFLDEGLITEAKAEQSYMSWRGHIRKKDARKTINRMDGLYYDLFGTRPWRKEGTDHGENQRDQRGNQRPEAAAGEDRAKRKRIHGGAVQCV